MDKRYSQPVDLNPNSQNKYPEMPPSHNLYSNYYKDFSQPVDLKPKAQGYNSAYPDLGQSEGNKPMAHLNLNTNFNVTNSLAFY